MKPKIRVLVVDDHKIVREGICYIIDEEEDMMVIGQAGDGNEAIELTHSLNPDVILLDLIMPRKGGIEVIRQIIQENPTARILVLTSFSEDSQIYSAFQAGALGYLMKDAAASEVLEAIRRIYRGESCLPPIIARKLLREIAQPPKAVEPPEILTERETEILALVAQGYSNKQIAQELTISERTVYGHVYNILGKLQLDNRTQAAFYALRTGLIHLPDQ